MAGVYPFTDTQDFHPRGTQYPQSGTMDSPRPTPADFIYKGANKHHWAKVQSKIKQRLMAKNISYIDDEEEVARRSMPPPPALYLAPPAFLESPQDKEERQRQQKLIDESRKKREDKFEVYRDHFAKTIRRVSQHTTSSSRNPSSPTSSEPSRISCLQRPT